jgi:hypothetical protein
MVEKVGSSFMITKILHEHEAKLQSELEKYHQKYPLSPGMSRAQLKSFLPGSFNQRDYDALLERLQKVKKLRRKVILSPCTVLNPSRRQKTGSSSKNWLNYTGQVGSSHPLHAMLLRKPVQTPPVKMNSTPF